MLAARVRCRVLHGTALVLFLLGEYVQLVQGEILTPPYFNLAEGRKITATATCGEDTEGPELYCKLVGTKNDLDIDVNVIQGQFCDICDPTKPDKKHPPEFAVDGMETWWQSPPLSRGMKYNKVNLTIDLGQEFHVAYVYIRMGNSPRPGLWVLEKSADYGQTYTPWQYFSDSQADCETHFGSDSLKPISKDDSIICSTEYSNILPLENGEIPVSLLNNRPSANHYFNSTVLQEWTRATNVRMRFLRTKNFLGHLMSVAKQDPTVTRRYFYSIKDISIGGRCMCNGHADTCDQDPEDPSVLRCRCQHNTCGAKCNSCCPGFVQKAWRQSKVGEPFICEPCNCFNHANECLYDEEVDKNSTSLDIHGRFEGGGVCQNCQHNTTGINCNQCLPKFFKPYNKYWNETDACQPCNCDNHYSTGNCFDGTGKCECRAEYTAPDCDSCSFGHYGYPICKPCECNLNGTVGLQCESKLGDCDCLPNFGGKYCKECAPGFYNYPECTECKCYPDGSLSETCEHTSGNCSCKNNFGGKQCDQCKDGYFNFPECSYCSCDLKGTEQGICNKNSGECLCKEGYGGERCDKCVAGYYGYPDCKPCNCGKLGSVGKTCSASGKCSCLVNYAGRTCEQCSPGYYNYTECKACDCDSTGTNGVSCDTSGTCECHHNFDGIKCDFCKEGFYNFPACEDCNCHPAGVVAGFAGCGSVPPGELCQCKPRVEGRICNKCKALYWNLNPNNPLGCEECNCNPAGVLGGIAVCNPDKGQCVCKPSVIARKCSECADGSFMLDENNLFGCVDCGCDVGGAVNSICNKIDGSCSCQSRVSGRTCKEPLKTHYFPTLYQYQYEIEDGYTTERTPARYGHADIDFPNYSWKGYGIFSDLLQNEILQDVYILKPSFYKMVFKFVNKNPDTVVATIKTIPESSYENEQTAQVPFKTSIRPEFVTSTNAFLLHPGKWTISIKVPKGMLMDYFVLLPEDFYQPTILSKKVEKPCHINEKDICREYSYPNLTQFDSSTGSTGYTVVDGDRQNLNEFYLDTTHLSKVNIRNKVPVLNSAQPILSVDLTVNKPGSYVIVVNYVTPVADAKTHKLDANITGSSLVANGHATLYSCTYTMMCRQVIVNEIGGVGVFNFDSDTVRVDLEGTNPNVAIHSLIAIPVSEWSLDFITPKRKCIRKDGKCIPSSFRNPGESKKILFEHIENEESKNVPLRNFNTTSYFQISNTNNFIDRKGKVSTPGYYSFILHYYQPTYSEFNISVLIQNGQFYEAKANLQSCPSESGCRSLITQADGNFRFSLIENFMITFKDPANKEAYLFYILVVPSDFYISSYLEEEPFDESSEFIKTCGSNNFNIDTSNDGFCKDSVFSITAAHNGGALPCFCNYNGSLSFECDKFGGQCPCKPNVIGRKCEACKTGFFGFPNCMPCNCPSTAYCNPVSGECECPIRVTGERCDQCEPFTYGFDPDNPFNGCEECKCNPLGSEHSLQCDLKSGNCPCKKNVVGRQCNTCRPGHHSYPYCETCECDSRGTTEEICDQNTAECFCKKNVVGPACDICREGTYNLQDSNEHGCTDCFCFGKTNRCSPSTWVLQSLKEMNGWKLVNVSFGTKLETSVLAVEVQEVERETLGVDFTKINFKGQNAYFSAPHDYLGKRLSSYGGFFNYTIFYTIGQEGSALSGSDIVLEGADTYLTYSSWEQPPPAEEYITHFQFVESNFKLLDSNTPAKREHIMEVLRDLKGIYIRATYWSASVTTRLLDVYQDRAAPYASFNGYANNVLKLAPSVEQCSCPPAYQGLSCEECSPGHYKIKSIHGDFCQKCNCNGHATECDVETGVCLNCAHSTRGDHCELCAVGYHGNAKAGTPNDCLICACPLPIASNNFASACDVSSDGEKVKCECNDGYIGSKCDSCSPGFYGRPDVQGDYCKPCQCSGNIDPRDPRSCDTVSGECLNCLNNTFGKACALCAPGYFGDAIDQKDCQSCICDELGTDRCNSFTGECVCKPNVVGEKCDRCALKHYGFQSGRGCVSCDCGEASDSDQCDDVTGQCKCKDGAAGRTCDRCAQGHWNYTSDGCLSCQCKSDYSVGFGCNALTGQCECLQGVIGEKCDQCPHRWAFIPDFGCHECDTCTHALLDDTDSLAKLIDPVIFEFDSTQSAVFTQRRLNSLRDELEKLKPEFDEVDPTQINLNKSITLLETLEGDTKTQSRLTNFSLENGDTLKNNSDELKENAEKFLEDLLQTEIKTNNAINEVKDIIEQLNSDDGPEIEAAVAQGEQILDNIKQYNLTTRDEEATHQLNKVNELLKNITEFKQPVDDLNEDVNKLQGNLKNFSKTLDDLFNNTQYSLNKVMESNAFDKNGINSLKKKLQNIENYTLEAKNNLDESENYNLNTTKLLADASSRLGAIKTAPAELTAQVSDLNTTLNDNDKQLEKIRGDLIRQAQDHAEDMRVNVADLLHSLSDITNTSEDALKAANAYKDILDAVQDAKKAADSADADAQGALDYVDGDEIQKSTFQADQNASQALDKAHELFHDTSKKIEPALEVSKQDYDPVQAAHTRNDEKFNEIAKNFQNLKPQTMEKAYETAAENANQALEEIEDFKASVDENFAELETQKESAIHLPKHSDDTQRNIQQTEKQLNSIIVELPLVVETVETLPKKQKYLEGISKNLRGEIDKLKSQVLVARDLANRIRVGAKFYPNTTLELRNPTNLEDLSTSTQISGYFKTKDYSGLIFYLGNPEETKLKNTRTDDYMALVIQGGYPVLKFDVGNGPEQVISTKNVADNNWYQFIIDRTGHNAKLTIKSNEDDQDVTVNSKEIDGSYSIFNLDNDKSKLYVGGIPANGLNIQEPVDVNSFSGEINDLIIGDKHVSLWNFNNGYENNHGANDRKTVNMNTGLRFNGNGFAMFDARPYNLKHRSDIQLKFKTFATEGLLFLAGGNKTFIALELRNGKILYQYNLGAGTKTWATSKAYNDGQWHTISASRQGRRGKFTVDSENVPERPGQEIQGEQLESIELLSIGGFPTKHNYTEVSNINFDGCIEGASIMGTTIDFNQNQQAFDVSPGCPDKISKVVSFSRPRPGYVSKHSLSVSNEFKISLKFRTKEEDGLIFYAMNPDQSAGISLALHDGYLVLNSQRQELISQDTFNDSEWHVVSIMHTNGQLRIMFDDYKEKATDSPPTLHILHGKLFIGGLPSGLQAADGMVASSEPFYGCIGDLTLNGEVFNFAVNDGRHNEILGKCTLDKGDDVMIDVPKLPPIHDTESITTLRPTFTENPFERNTTLRGDGGFDTMFKAPVTQATDEDNEPHGPVGTVPPTTPKTHKDSCALTSNFEDDSMMASNTFRFGTQKDSRLVYPTPRGRSKKQSDHLIEFRTTDSEGILLYVSDRTEAHQHFMALFLSNGQLVFSFNGEGLPAVIKTEEYFNDDLWHTAEFKRDGPSGELRVDGGTVYKGEAVNAEKLDLKAPYYIGGLEPADYNVVQDNLNTTATFSGCLRNFMMNGKPMQTPQLNGVIPCSENVETGTFFTGSSSSYIKLKEKFLVGQEFNIKLDIKPRTDNALLIAAHGRKDYLVLEIVNGSMRLSVDHGKGVIMATYVPPLPFYLCNGEWHNIQAVKSKNVVTLSVNNVFSKPRVGDHNHQTTNTGSALFLGGHRMLKKVRGLNTRQAFVGCIKNVVLNSEPIMLTPSMATGNITVGSCRTN